MTRVARPRLRGGEPAGRRLCRLLPLPVDPCRAPKEVDPIDCQPGCLARPQPGPSADDDGHSVPRVSSIEQQLHLVGGERHDGRRLDPRQSETDGGVGDDQLVVDGAGEGRSDLLANDADGARGEDVAELGDQRLDVALVDAAIGRSPNLSIA